METTTMESLSLNEDCSVELMCILYITLGVMDILCSCFDIVVFTVKPESRRRYVLFIALDFAEMVNGISYIMCGYGRNKEVIDGVFNVPITFHECFLTKNWVTPLIMGTELPAFITIVISVERITAVLRPKAYSRYWHFQFKLCCVFGAVFAQALSLLLAYRSAVGNMELSTTRHCAIINSTSTLYSISHFLFVVLAYIISFASLLVVRLFFSNRGGNGGNSRGPQLKLLLCITGAAIVLVAIPSIVMIGLRLGFYTASNIAIAITYSGPGFLTLATTVINFACRPEYRQQLYSLLHIRSAQPDHPAFIRNVPLSSHKTMIS